MEDADACLDRVFALGVEPPRQIRAWREIPSWPYVVLQLLADAVGQRQLFGDRPVIEQKPAEAPLPGIDLRIAGDDEELRGMVTGRSEHRASIVLDRRDRNRLARAIEEWIAARIALDAGAEREGPPEARPIDALLARRRELGACLPRVLAGLNRERVDGLHAGG